MTLIFGGIICFMVAKIACQPVSVTNKNNLAWRVSEIERNVGRYAPEYPESNMDRYENMGRYAPEYIETDNGSFRPEMEYALSRVLLPPPVEEPVKEGDVTQLYNEWYPKMFTASKDIISGTSDVDEVSMDLAKNYFRDESSYEDFFPEIEAGEKVSGPDDDVDKLYSPRYLVTPTQEALSQLGAGEKFAGPHPTGHVDDVDKLYSHWYLEIPSEDKLPQHGAGVRYMGPVPTDVDTLYSQGYPDTYSKGAIIDQKLKHEDPASNMIFDFGKQFLKIKNKYIVEK